MAKLFFIANSSWYLWNFRSETIKTFVVEGYDVTILVPDEEYRENFSDLDCRYETFLMKKSSKNPFCEFLTILCLLFRLQSCSICFTFGPKPNFYCTLIKYLVNITVIANFSGFGRYYEKQGFLGKLVTYLTHFSMKKADYTIFQNLEDHARSLRTGHIQANTSFQVNGSGVDLTKFYNRNNYNTDATLRVAFVGRLITQKGVYDYIDAIAILRNLEQTIKLKAYIIGSYDQDDPDKISIEVVNGLASTNSIRCVFNEKNVHEYLSDFDVVVLPTKYPEGMPKVLLEANASGCFVVSYDNNAARSAIIPAVNGYICNDNCPTQLADFLMEILHWDNCLRAKVRAQCRKHAEDYFDVVVNINVYRKIVSTAVGDKCEAI